MERNVIFSRLNYLKLQQEKRETKLKSEKRAILLSHRISKQLPIELFNKFFVEPRDADVDGITMTIQLCVRTCANPNSNGPRVYCYFINIPSYIRSTAQ